jgi:hypothetical protein
MSDPSPRARGGKTLLIVLLAIFVALAVVVAWMWSGSPTQPSVEEGRAVADSFLQLIRTGKAAQAWESTTAEFKSAEGRESFLRYVKKHPFLAKPMTFVSMQTVMIEDKPRGEYVYRPSDGTATVRLLAGREHDAWRVDRILVE